MIENDRISPQQMALLLLAFTLGSSIVFIPGPAIAAAGNDTWIAVLLSGIVGLPGLAAILYLHRRFPDKSAVEYFGELFGKWLGMLLSIVILFILVLMVTNITAGVGSFFTSTMMVETPFYAFHTLIMVVSGLTALAGIEVMARLFSLFLFVMLATILIILVFNVNNYIPDNLLPQFNGSVGSLFHGALITHGFPYEEVFVFCMLLVFVRPVQKQPLGRFMLYAYLLNIAIFLAVVLCAIMVFGTAAGQRKFTLYEMARIIELPGIVERIEAIAGINLIAGSYIKAAIAMFALSSGLSQLLKLKDSRTVILPMTLLIIFMSFTLFSNELDALVFWTQVWPAVTSSGTAILLAAAIVALFRMNK